MNNFLGVVSFDRKTNVWQWGQVTIKNTDEIPRSVAHNNYVGYFTADVRSADWASILGPNDQVFGSEPGNILGVKIHLEWENDSGDIKTGHYVILDPKVWGLKPSEYGTISSLQTNLLTKIARLQKFGGCPVIGRSIASTSMKWYMRFFDDQEVNGVHHPKMTQLPPRWRNIAHAAFHGGPIACLRGGSKYAVEIDLSGAFLHALTKPVPIVTIIPDTTSTNDNRQNDFVNYSYQPGVRWNSLKEEDGFVEATVLVPHDCGQNLPPLPIHTNNGTTFPTGLFRGTWTIPLLREAERLYGVKVQKIHQHSIATRMMPLFRQIATVWSNMPKEYSKPLYTRFWGKFGFQGGWGGSIHDTSFEDFESRSGSVPMDYFWWENQQYDQKSHDLLGSYRPDISAYISSYNHIRMMQAMKMLKPGSIIACHVDAIWTDDIEGAQKVIDHFQADEYTGAGYWKIAHEGKLRFWAAGVYDHNGKMGWSGFDPNIYGHPTSEKLARFVVQKENCGDTFRNRRWNTLDSTVSAEAKSRAPRLRHLTTRQTTFGLPVTSPVFTSSGWIHPDYT